MEHDTNLNRTWHIFAKYWSSSSDTTVTVAHKDTVSPHHNHFSLRLHQTLFVAKPERYKNADFLAIPQSRPLSLHILDILSYLLSFYHFHPPNTMQLSIVLFLCALLFFALSTSLAAGAPTPAKGSLIPIHWEPWECSFSHGSEDIFTATYFSRIHTDL